MRVVGRALLLLLLLLFSLWGWRQGWVQQWQLPVWLGGTAMPDARLATAQPSTAYLLDKEHWLEFVVSGHGDLIKVLSNANILKRDQHEIDRIWNYALDYQLLDGAGRMIEERRYHHRSKQLFYTAPVEPLASAPISPAALGRYFYLTGELVPNSSAALRIRASEIKLPAVLRLRLADTDPDVVDVVVRVYQPDPVPDALAGLAWQRLSAKKRERLARGTVYGADELRQEEAGNLLHNRHTPIGPQGVRGEHYQDRILYTFGDEEDDLLKEGVDVAPAGLFADGWLHGVISVPERGAQMALTFAPVNRTLAPGETVLLRWFGPQRQQRRSETVKLTAKGLSIKRRFEGGIVEIVAQQPLVIQTQRLDSDDQEAIEQGAFYLKTYLATEAPLEYRIDHDGRQATPWRVDLRTFTAGPGGEPQTAARQVRYELLGDQGQIIQSGHLDINPAWSHYDRFGDDVSGRRISDPSRYYFSLPLAVQRVRIYASGAALVAAFTRPHDLPYRLTLPENNFAVADVVQRQPAWFIQQPQEKGALEATDRAVLIQLLSRPPVDDADILAGRYRWQNFLPDGRWLGRYLLQPREPGAPLRDEALGSIYRPVAAGRSQQFDFHDLAGIAELTPELIFIRDNDMPMHVTVLLDGVAVVVDEVAQARGQLSLPALRVGPHQLKIDASSPARWFINYTGSGAESYLKRLVQRLPAEGLDFYYDKTEADAVVSAQLFLPQTTERAQLRVTVEGPAPRGIGPFLHWSFLDRINDVRPPQGERLVLLNTRNETVGDGERLFMPLGSDLPNGRYRIHVELAQRQSAYLALYQMTPGSFDTRSFFFERIFSDGTER